MKLYDTIFFLRLVFPPILCLGGGASAKIVLPFGKGWKESAWNPMVPLNQTQNLLRGKGLNTDAYIQKQAELTKIPPAAAPAPEPAHEGAIISARSTMNQVRSRQGRASTILTASTSSSNNALRTVLGTPLQ